MGKKIKNIFIHIYIHIHIYIYIYIYTHMCVTKEKHTGLEQHEGTTHHFHFLYVNFPFKNVQHKTMTRNISLSSLEEHLIMKLFKTEVISHYFILHYLYHSSFVLFWGGTKLRGKPDRLQLIKHASNASPACHSLSAAAHRSVETPPTQNHITLCQRWKFWRSSQIPSHLTALCFSAGQNLQKCHNML